MWPFGGTETGKQCYDLTIVFKNRSAQTRWAYFSNDDEAQKWMKATVADFKKAIPGQLFKISGGWYVNPVEVLSIDVSLSWII